MKSRTIRILVALIIPVLSVLNPQFSAVFAQGAAFTYQGQLFNGATPANGSYDLAFTLFATNTGGAAVAGPVTNTAVAVSSGLFTTTVNFGPGIFTGGSNWLQIAVSTNAANNFTNLSPRQQLTPVPYAIFANTASNLSGTLPTAQLSGTIPASQLNGTIAAANLPGNVVTNDESGLNLNGSFTGNAGALTNIQLSSVGPAGTFGQLSEYFAPPVTYPVGSGPYAVVAITNFNGHGGTALVSANYGEYPTTTLTVLTNNGSGYFSSNATLTVEQGPVSVASADINGDGSPDLVAVSAYLHFATVLTNDGVGDFIVSGYVGFSGEPQFVALADTAGHGKPDLIVAISSGSAASGSVEVLTNNGTGVFGTNATYTVGRDPFFIIATNLVNSFGRPDLAVANFDSGTLTVLTNNGNGVFGSNATLVVNTNIGTETCAVAAADVNRDGKMDLIATSQGNSTVTIFTNNGSSFGSNATLSVTGARGIVAADINGDGKADLLVTSSGANNIVTVLTNGGGVFGFNTTLTVGNDPLYITAADVNGDGRLDFVTANFEDSTLTVIYGFPQALSVTNAVSLTDSANSFDGSFAGNGSGLTALNALQLTSGTIPLSVENPDVVTNTETGVTLNGAFSGDGSGLINLPASQLTTGPIPLAVENSAVLTNSETGVTLSGTFSGNGGGLTNLNVNGTQVTGTLTSLSVSNLVSGGFGSDVAAIVNGNTSGNTGPALRVVGYGNTTAGALSVSSQGTGLIAQFGNAIGFVADITTNGTFEGSGYNGGTLRVGNSGTTITNLQAGQAIMPSSSLQETNYTITFPTPFSSLPKVIASLSGDTNYPTATDTFAMSIRAITTTTNFTINVFRVDVATGWSQQLRINWQAWQ